jgi:hypothetical protein
MILNQPASTAKGPRGLGQLLGLDPRIAFLTFIVDMMLFGGEIATLGASIVVSIPVGIALGIIAYRAQMRWYGDDRESAVIKGMILGLLTAIPTALPAIIYVPSGIIGLIHNLAQKRLGK